MSWREEDEWWFCSVSLWQVSTLLVSDSSLPSRTLNNKLPPSSLCLSVSLLHSLSLPHVHLGVCVCVCGCVCLCLSDLLSVFLFYKYLARNETLAALCVCGVKHTPAHAHTHTRTHTMFLRQYPLKYYRVGTCYKPLHIRPNPFWECQFHSWDVKHLRRKVKTFQWKLHLAHSQNWIKNECYFFCWNSHHVSLVPTR